MKLESRVLIVSIILVGIGILFAIISYIARIIYKLHMETDKYKTSESKFHKFVVKNNSKFFFIHRLCLYIEVELFAVGTTSILIYYIRSFIELIKQAS